MTDEAPADVVIQTSHQSQCYRIVQFHQDRSLHAFPPALGNEVDLLYVCCEVSKVDTTAYATNVVFDRHWSWGQEAIKQGLA